MLYLTLISFSINFLHSKCLKHYVEAIFLFKLTVHSLMASKRGVLGSLLLNTVETKLFNKEKSQIVETSKVFKCSAAYLRLLVRTIKHD